MEQVRWFWRRLKATALGAGAGVFALALLSACTPIGAGMMAGASLISYLETDKTIPEHVLSQVMDKDCAAKNMLETGRMCGEDVRITVAQQIPSYCYRTLGAITCYTTPDPFRSRSPEVASPTAPRTELAVAGRDGENRGD